MQGERAFPPSDRGLRPAEQSRIVDTLMTAFAGTVSRERISLVVADSYNQLAETASVFSYLPVLTERVARDRLLAFEALEGNVDNAERQRSDS
jgi:hypothetical protein